MAGRHGRENRAGITTGQARAKAEGVIGDLRTCHRNLGIYAPVTAIFVDQKNLYAKLGKSVPALTRFESSELRRMEQNVEIMENSIRLELGLEIRKSYVS